MKEEKCASQVLPSLTSPAWRPNWGCRLYLVREVHGRTCWVLGSGVLMMLVRGPAEQHSVLSADLGNLEFPAKAFLWLVPGKLIGLRALLLSPT